MTASTCAIQIERLDDGRYRASCTLYPDLETFGSTSEIAEQLLQDAIQEHLRKLLHLPPETLDSDPGV